MTHTDNFEDLDSEIDPELRKKVAQRSTWVSVVTNIVLIIVQMIAGCLTASQGLIADGLHSLADIVSDVVVLMTQKHSHKAPDEDHHYGHYRYETAASLVLGLLLLLVGMGMINAALLNLTKVLTSTSQTIPFLAFGVAAATVVAKETLFRYMMNEAKKIRSQLLIANAWHARSDAASSLIVAIGVLGNHVGYPALDPIAALLVGLLVARMGWRFASEALFDLMDRSVEEAIMGRIRQELLATQGLLGIHDLRTRKIGDFIWVDVHLEVAANITVAEGHEISVQAKKQLMVAIPCILNVMTHVDPVDVVLEIPAPTE
ncbi:MAG: cation diffusion facilitator family transporter [Pseudomonadota bacterium]